MSRQRAKRATSSPIVRQRATDEDVESVARMLARVLLGVVQGPLDKRQTFIDAAFRLGAKVQRFRPDGKNGNGFYDAQQATVYYAFHADDEEFDCWTLIHEIGHHLLCVLPASKFSRAANYALECYDDTRQSFQHRACRRLEWYVKPWPTMDDEGNADAR